MGGREAVRGFAVQTLVCLLDAISEDAEWIAVTIEPDTPNDKVDILWEYATRSKAIQVKSSRNAMGRADIEAWCRDLEASGMADAYELRLAGPLTSNAMYADTGRVVVPPSSSLVLSDLNDQAVTRLDRYLANVGIDAVPVGVRTSLVSICAARLVDGSASGRRLERREFDGWLLHWIAAAYPEALAARLSANCEVLWGSIQIRSPPTGSKAFEIALPLVFHNSGRSAAVVEWAIVMVDFPGRRMIYGSTAVRRDGDVLPFCEFAVGCGQVEERTVVFRPFKHPGFQTDAWPLGDHELNLLVKFSAEPSPRPVKSATLGITGEHMSLHAREGVLDMPISSLASYILSL